MVEENTKGAVFNLQHYSIHDGPGIRTTVFLKGCPLRCRWCQNPESQDKKPVLFFNAGLCTGCGTCVDACPESAISIVETKSRTDRNLCKGDAKCVDVCPNDARSIMGQYMTANEVFEDVNRDAIFYQDSGGGVTLSGGDPVAQPDFAISILNLCREAGFHTAIETCGFTVWEVHKRILQYTDLVLYDIKHMNPDEHKMLTGVSNELILENAKRVRHEMDKAMSVRLPIIPGYNDSQGNLEMTAGFIRDNLDGIEKVHLLPYHRLGETKYERMEEKDIDIDIEPPSDERMEEIKSMFESYGLVVVIGG